MMASVWTLANMPQIEATASTSASTVRIANGYHAA